MSMVRCNNYVRQLNEDGSAKMNLTCKLCGKRVIVADDIVPGQHVRCPFCGGKFSYTTVSKKKKGATGQADAKRLSRQRGRSPWAEALISAIVIVAVVCCGMFACRTFERFWNDNDGRSHETVPPPKSNGENVNFEFDDSEKTEKMEELGRCIAERKNKATLLNKKVEDALKLVKEDWEQMVDGLDGGAKTSLQDNLKKVGNAMQEQCVGLGKLQKNIDRAVNVINDAEAIGNDESSSLAQIEKAIKDVQSCDLGQIENELVRLAASDDYFLETGMDVPESGFSSDGDDNKDAFSIAVETNNVAVVSNRMEMGEVVQGR